MSELAQVLRHVAPVEDVNVLVDAAARDDAAVYQLTPSRALVATVDFFTPIVDDARTWGRIAAANALSDLYAMGAAPLFALSLVGWPRDVLPLDLLGEVMEGLSETTRLAHCPILGGHSVDALEPQVGLAAIGEAHPARLLTNRSARPGDRIVLTKPIGTGILSTALKRDLLGEADLSPAIASMTTLNEGAMRAALAHGVRAATDVTGFGLLGHLRNLVDGSGVGARLDLARVPIFPGARQLAKDGVVPGGTQRNLASLEDVHWAGDIGGPDRLLLADAQTSGGLLLAVPPDRLDALLDSLRQEHTIVQAVIGEFTGAPGLIQVERGG